MEHSREYFGLPTYILTYDSAFFPSSCVQLVKEIRDSKEIADPQSYLLCVCVHLYMYHCMHLCIHVCATGSFCYCFGFGFLIWSKCTEEVDIDNMCVCVCVHLYVCAHVCVCVCV